MLSWYRFHETQKNSGAPLLTVDGLSRNLAKLQAKYYSVPEDR